MEITLPKLKPEAQKKSGPTRGHIAKSGQGPGSPGAWQNCLSHDYSSLVQRVWYWLDTSSEPGPVPGQALLMAFQLGNRQELHTSSQEGREEGTPSPTHGQCFSWSVGDKKGQYVFPRRRNQQNQRHMERMQYVRCHLVESGAQRHAPHGPVLGLDQVKPGEEPAGWVDFSSL